jgi:hypothetical protein
MAYQEGDKVWLYSWTRTKEKSPKLLSSWEGPYRAVTWINDAVYRIQQNPRTKMMVYTWTSSRLTKELLGTSGPQEEAVEEVGQKQHANLSTKKDGWMLSKPEVAAQARCWKCHPPGRIHTSLWKRRCDGMPVGYSERAALRREQCGMSAESQNCLTRRDVCYLVTAW